MKTEDSKWGVTINSTNNQRHQSGQVAQCLPSPQSLVKYRLLPAGETCNEENLARAITLNDAKKLLGMMAELNVLEKV